MPQAQFNALSAVSHQLPEIAKQLKITNKLKALELKLQYHGRIDDDGVDKILKGE